jgi:hypothetical protein
MYDISRLRVKHQPANRYEVTPYIYSEKNESNLLLKYPDMQGKRGAPEQDVVKR